MPRSRLFCQSLTLALLTLVCSPPLFAQEVVAPARERYERPYDESRGVLSYADLLGPSLRTVVKLLNLAPNEESGALQVRGSGSGVIFEADEGLIMTNAHVVDGASVLAVELFNGELVEAELVGADERSDIAVVRTARALEHQNVFVDTDTIRIGDQVFAAGYPRGLDQGVSAGIISGLNRRGFKTKRNDLRIEDFIQTDSAINPGNSGGPLLDSRGRVVGINTWIISGDDGLGFAVPANVAVQVAQRLVSGGYGEPGWFGAVVDSLSPNEALERELDTLRGVVVNRIEPDSPASRADLRAGDIIIAAGGREIGDVYQFANFILLGELGVPLTVYFRRGKEK